MSPHFRPLCPNSLQQCFSAWNLCFAPFFLCPTFQSLTSKNCLVLPCHSLPAPSSTQRWSFICVCVCWHVCRVGLCWWSLKPWESTHIAVCLPSSPLSPKHCRRAAFKSTGDAMKGCVHSFSLSLFLTVTVYLHSASVLAYCLLLLLATKAGTRTTK